MSADPAGNGRAAPDGWLGHVLWMGECDDVRRPDLAAWIRHGLRRGEKVLYGVVPEVATPLLDVLARHGFDPTEAVARGQLEIMPLASLFPADEQRRVVEEALAQGYPRVRISAEALGALHYLTAGEYVRAEHTMDALCRRYPLSALCQYPTHTVDDGSLEMLALTHSGGVLTPLLRTLRMPQALVLAGEVDASNSAMLAAVLAVAARGRDRGPLRVDCAQLEFLAVSGWRALHAGTAELRAEGGRVEIVDPSPPVARCLHLLGLGDGMNVVSATAEPS